MNFNMNKIISLLFFNAFIINVYGQDVESILKQYATNSGIDKLKTVNTIISKGIAYQMGMEFPFTLYQKRPDKVRNEILYEGQKMLQVYAGGMGWMVNPMMGTTKAYDLTGFELKEAQQRAKIEGPLYNAQNVTIKDAGAFYELSSNENGTITIYELDKTAFVINKIRFSLTIEGQKYSVVQQLKDYKLFSGVKFPTLIETYADGNLSLKVIIKEVTFNTPVDDKLFNKP